MEKPRPSLKDFIRSSLAAVGIGAASIGAPAMRAEAATPQNTPDFASVLDGNASSIKIAGVERQVAKPADASKPFTLGQNEVYIAPLAQNGTIKIKIGDETRMVSNIDNCLNIDGNNAGQVVSTDGKIPVAVLEDGAVADMLGGIHKSEKPTQPGTQVTVEVIPATAQTDGGSGGDSGSFATPEQTNDMGSGVHDGTTGNLAENRQ